MDPGSVFCRTYDAGSLGGLPIHSLSTLRPGNAEILCRPEVPNCMYFLSCYLSRMSLLGTSRISINLPAAGCANGNPQTSSAWTNKSSLELTYGLIHLGKLMEFSLGTPTIELQQ